MTAQKPSTEVKSVVVVVEDDRYILDFLKFTLEQQGYAVHTAADGQDGFDKIKSCRPSLVVLDLMLPRMDGFTILKNMSENPEIADVPVVVVSAYTASESTRRMVENQKNVREVFTKPIRSRDFIARLRQILQAN